MNLLSPLPSPQPDESLTTLVQEGPVRIERIVSYGHFSPEDFWYDQPAHEWVMLLEGEATMAYPDGTTVRLFRGDSLQIPAHQRHRVSYTACPTVWLAVHYPAQ